MNPLACSTIRTIKGKASFCPLRLQPDRATVAMADPTEGAQLARQLFRGCLPENMVQPVLQAIWKLRGLIETIAQIAGNALVEILRIVMMKV